MCFVLMDSSVCSFKSFIYTHRLYVYNIRINPIDSSNDICNILKHDINLQQFDNSKSAIII